MPIRTKLHVLQGINPLWLRGSCLPSGPISPSRGENWLTRALTKHKSRGIRVFISLLDYPSTQMPKEAQQTYLGLVLGLFFLHLGRCTSPLELYTCCTRGKGLGCHSTTLGWLLEGCTGCYALCVGCWRVALAPTHVGTVTPLRFGADLGGSYSRIALQLLATQLSNAHASWQRCRSVLHWLDTPWCCAFFMCALGHDTSIDVYSLAPFGALALVQHTTSHWW